jgi:hypothetical protein
MLWLSIEGERLGECDGGVEMLEHQYWSSFSGGGEGLGTRRIDLILLL